MVKSSLTGSILGNLLFGLGVSFFAGGISTAGTDVRPPGRPDDHRAVDLASFGLIVPAVTRYSASALRSISRETAVVLFVVYLASLVAILANRKPVIGKEAVKANLEEKAERPDEVREAPEDGWSRNTALLILAAVTV